MKKINSLVVFILFSLASFSLKAATEMDPSSAVAIVMQSMSPAATVLQANAWKWLSMFILIQFIWTNIKSLTTGGEIDSVWPKFLSSLFWFGICFYIMENGPNFLNNVGSQFFDLVGGGLPSPSSIMVNTTAMSSGLAVVAAGVGFFNQTAGQLVLYVLLAILIVGIFFAIKILMIQLELALIVMLSPMSFALLGLNAFKDQGIAPFKSLVSLAYRIVLTSVILSAFVQVDVVVGNIINTTSADTIATDGVGKVISSLIGGLGAYILLAVLLYKSDSIAASLASGGTSMGTADMASGVAAGVAAGMAASAGSAAVAGSSSKGISSVSDMVKGLRTEAASVTNAGGSGFGGSGGPNSSNGMFSLGDAPKSNSKSPDYSAKDLHQIAKDKGLPPVGGAQKSSANGEIQSTTKSPNSISTNNTGSNVNSGNQSSSANKQSSPTTSKASPSALPNENIQSAPVGNPHDASISGTGSNGLENQLSALVDQLSKQGESKPSAKDRLSSLNNHIERESAVTHVSINSHNND